MSKKKTWLKVIAIVSAVAGIAVAVAAYLKKKSKRLSEELDFDNSLYFDEETPIDDEEYTEEDVDVTEEDINAVVESLEDDSNKDTE